jgi:hypothetical protein
MYGRMNVAMAFVSGAGMFTTGYAADLPVTTAAPSAVTALHCAHLVDVVNGKAIQSTISAS